MPAMGKKPLQRRSLDNSTRMRARLAALAAICAAGCALGCDLAARLEPQRMPICDCAACV